MRENNPPGGKPPANPFVAAVRVQLALAGMSAAEMSRRIKMPLSTFSRRMTGETPFLAEELVAIAVQLGIPAALLIEQAEAVALAQDDERRAQDDEPVQVGAA